MVKPETFFVDSLLVVAGTAEFGQAIVDTGTTLTYFPQQSLGSTTTTPPPPPTAKCCLFACVVVAFFLGGGPSLGFIFLGEHPPIFSVCSSGLNTLFSDCKKEDHFRVDNFCEAIKQEIWEKGAEQLGRGCGEGGKGRSSKRY